MSTLSLNTPMTVKGLSYGAVTVPTGNHAVAATYSGVRLHPVLLARALWDAVPDGTPINILP